MTLISSAKAGPKPPVTPELREIAWVRGALPVGAIRHALSQTSLLRTRNATRSAGVGIFAQAEAAAKLCVVSAPLFFTSRQYPRNQALANLVKLNSTNSTATVQKSHNLDSSCTEMSGIVVYSSRFNNHIDSAAAEVNLYVITFP